MSSSTSVSELRLAVTVDDFDAAVAFYRDALGLDELNAWEAPTGRVMILDAGRATLELLDRGQAEIVDDIEVGRRVAGPIRVALEVADSEGTADRLVAAGAEQLAPPAVTPWNHRNVRVEAPGLQLTLFTVLPGQRPDQRLDGPDTDPPLEPSE